MDKLKPCPFCGESHAVLLKPTCKQTDAYDSHDRAFPMVCCPLCNAEKHGENWDQSGESAIKAWNTRTVDDELTAARGCIAELEKALGPFAREAGTWGEHEDETEIVKTCNQTSFFPINSTFTVGDLRRAAALLKEKE